MRLPLLLTTFALSAAACTPAEGGGDATPTPVTVQVEAEALSPYAIEVRWTTATEAASPVAFDDGSGEEAVTGDPEDLVTEHRVLLQSLEANATYDIRVGDGTGFTGTASESTPASGAGPFRVLFDAAHGEDAGNADWIIDEQGSASPSPASPGSESSWSGAYSAWGFDLWDTGRYEVESLPNSAGSFTYGSGAQDLADYCAVVLAEPNNSIPASGLAALRDYVAGGGGLFLIANHFGSDRDNDDVQSIDAINELADLDPAWGWRIDEQDLYEPAASDFVADAREPLLHGPFGEVAAVGFYAATTLRIVPAENPRMRQILWRPNQSGNAGLFIAAGFYGAGKVVLVGDSAPADDGTANTGNSPVIDSWNDPTEDNAAFFLNATAWLCDDGG